MIDLPFAPLSAVTVLVAAVVAVEAVLVWARSTRAYLVFVVIMLAASRTSLDMGGLTLRADQLAVLALAAPIFGAAGIGRIKFEGAHRTLTASLAGYVCLGGLSRLLYGGPLAEVMRATLLIGVAVFAFWIPSLLVRRGVSPADMTNCTIAVATAAGALAVLLGAASYIFNSSLGVQRDPIDPRLHLAYVSFYEANLLGVFLAAALVLVLLHPIVGTWRPAARTLVPVVIGAGLLATLTRGSWIGLAAGLIVGWFTLRRGSLSRRRLWPKLSAGALALVIVAGVSPLRSMITARIADVLDFSSGSGFGRVRITNMAMDEWRTSLAIGRGFLSFKQTLPGTAAGLSGWIPSLSVAVLHDTGVLGAAAMLVFFVVLVRRLWKRADRASAAAWIGVSVSLVVAGQATQPQVLPYFWFLLGLAAVAAEAPFASAEGEAGALERPRVSCLAGGRGT